MSIGEEYYTKVTFDDTADKPLISFGDDYITKHWISRSSHGYVIEKRARYTVLAFILNPYNNEDMETYRSRILKHSINLYEAYETNKDANIDHYVNQKK